MAQQTAEKGGREPMDGFKTAAIDTKGTVLASPTRT